LCRSISFSLFRIVLTLAYTSITNPAGQTQSCIYAQALAEQPTWVNLIAPSPSKHSRSPHRIQKADAVYKSYKLSPS